MAEIYKLSDRLSVATQLQPSDMAAIVEQGFKAIICNRPDGEDLNQPSFSSIERAARESGLEVRFQPIVSGQFDASDVSAFGAELAALDGPVLAYCRTGTRCTVLWSLSEIAQGTPRALVLDAALKAGFDMSRVIPG